MWKKTGATKTIALDGRHHEPAEKLPEIDQQRHHTRLPHPERRDPPERRAERGRARHAGACDSANIAIIGPLLDLGDAGHEVRRLLAHRGHARQQKEHVHGDEHRIETVAVDPDQVVAALKLYVPFGHTRLSPDSPSPRLAITVGPAVEEVPGSAASTCTGSFHARLSRLHPVSSCCDTTHDRSGFSRQIALVFNKVAPLSPRVLHFLTVTNTSGTRTDSSESATY